MCVHECWLLRRVLTTPPDCRRQTRYRRRTARRLLSSVQTALHTRSAFASRRQRVLPRAVVLPVERWLAHQAWAAARTFRPV